MTKPIPKKLKEDAIVEALLEIRFSAPGVIPEVLWGRLADVPAWKGFQQRRLPAAEIPAPIRRMDAGLRYAPLLEFSDQSRMRLVRIGERVISYHQLAPYVGWDRFRPDLFQTVDALFSTAGSPQVSRTGLRYVNALTPTAHNIRTITDLDLQVTVEAEVAPQNINLNFSLDVEPNTTCTVRIATADFIVGKLPDGTTVVVDIDVYTKEPVRFGSAAEVKSWIEVAHGREKEQFFRLLTHERIQALTEM